jgi:hypothetical protein
MSVQGQPGYQIPFPGAPAQQIEGKIVIKEGRGQPEPHLNLCALKLGWVLAHAARKAWNPQK